MPINASAVQNDARSAHFFCFSSFNQSDITARSICTRPNPVHQACLHICPENCTAHLHIRAGGCNPNSKCCDPSTHMTRLVAFAKDKSKCIKHATKFALKAAQFVTFEAVLSVATTKDSKLVCGSLVRRERESIDYPGRVMSISDLRRSDSLICKQIDAFLTTTVASTLGCIPTLLVIHLDGINVRATPRTHACREDLASSEIIEFFTTRSTCKMRGKGLFLNCGCADQRRRCSRLWALGCRSCWCTLRVVTVEIGREIRIARLWQVCKGRALLLRRDGWIVQVQSSRIPQFRLASVNVIIGASLRHDVQQALHPLQRAPLDCPIQMHRHDGCILTGVRRHRIVVTRLKCCALLAIWTRFCTLSGLRLCLLLIAFGLVAINCTLCRTALLLLVIGELRRIAAAILETGQLVLHILNSSLR